MLSKYSQLGCMARIRSHSESTSAANPVVLWPTTSEPFNNHLGSNPIFERRLSISLQRARGNWPRLYEPARSLSCHFQARTSRQVPCQQVRPRCLIPTRGGHILYLRPVSAGAEALVLGYSFYFGTACADRGRTKCATVAEHSLTPTISPPRSKRLSYQSRPILTILHGL